MREILGGSPLIHIIVERDSLVNTVLDKVK